MNAFQFCLIQCCILTITLYGLVISELLRLKKNVADIFGIGLIFFWRIYYGIYFMVYLCQIRINHYGKVCFGDFMKQINLAGYDESQQ